MQRTKYILYLFFLFVSTAVSAQNIVETFGARSNALGGAVSTQSDVFSVFSNQAGLADIEQFSASVYGENRFLIPDLNAISIAAAIPTKSGTFGIGANYYGLESYNTLRATLAYGRKLFEDKLNIGAEFDYINLNIPEYGSKPIITFGLGVQYRLNESLIAAAHVLNPLQIQTTSLDADVGEDLLESSFKFGLAYVPSEQVGIYLETRKTLNHPAGFNGGVEYNVLKKLVLRAGFTTIPSRLIEGRFGTDLATANFGIGVKLNPICIDLSNRFHPILGHSPSLTISFQPQSKTKAVNEKK